MATNHKRLGIREIIRIYEKLHKEEKIGQNGSAFKRMRTLQTILKNRKKNGLGLSKTYYSKEEV